MARVVPVGPLDAELYGFAKKEAERAERDPRYVPKNCPAERGKIIYKRIGAMVKALVIAKGGLLIGAFETGYNLSFIPLKAILAGPDFEQIETYHSFPTTYAPPVRVDGYGDWYHPSYSKTLNSRSKGFGRIGGLASRTTVTTTTGGGSGTQYVSLYFISSSSSEAYDTTYEETIKIYEKYLDVDYEDYTGSEDEVVEGDPPIPHYDTKRAKFLRENLKIRVAHTLTITTAGGSTYSGASVNNNGYITTGSSSTYWSSTIDSVACGRKEDDYIVLCRRSSSTQSDSLSTSSEGLYESSNSLSQSTSHHLYVGGAEEWSREVEGSPYRAPEVFFIPRMDDGGLLYLLDFTHAAAEETEFGDLGEFGWVGGATYGAIFAAYPSHSFGTSEPFMTYPTLANKYGVFVVSPATVSKDRKDSEGKDTVKHIGYWVVLWVRAKESPGEGSSARIELLDRDTAEVIVITPREPPKFGEKDGEDYPGGDDASWDYPYMLFATTSDKDAVIVADQASKYDLSKTIRKYSALEMSAGDVQEWRAPLGGPAPPKAGYSLKFPLEAGAPERKQYMHPGAMEKPVRPLIDALYFPPEDE